MAEPVPGIEGLVSIWNKTNKLGKFLFKAQKAEAKFLWGPGGFGLFGLSKRIGTRFIVPGLLFAGYGAFKAMKGLIGAPYSMENARIGGGRSYSSYPMHFSSFPRNIDMGATGSLSFALHNRRKG